MHILLHKVYLFPSASLAGSLVFQSLWMLGHRQVHPENFQKAVRLEKVLWMNRKLDPQLTGNTIRSNELLAALSRSTSATSLTFREAKISSLSSTEATTTFAFARLRISMIITASISSVPLAIGTRIWKESKWRYPWFPDLVMCVCA